MKNKKKLNTSNVIKKNKVSVIIPAFNEANTIENVIRLVKTSKNVDEVIVIDDNSIDNTYEVAKKSGAKVFKSIILGKGSSMKEGLEIAKNEILIYIDGDIDNYKTDIIKKLSDPIINNKFDFVKATFNRNAGRVTELVAKPLLSILFPELTIYSQPLSGMIASKKEILKKVKFENDYGVDIGILIDVYNQGVKIKEVNIGKIENKSKPWQALGKMSREVSKAILKRAEIKKIFNLDELETMNIIQDEMENSINESITKLNKLIIFDMDDTILLDRFIYKMSEKYDFKNKLNDIITTNNEPYLITKLIAGLLKNMNIQELFNVIDKIKIVPDAIEVIKALKARGYIIAIISDSYDIITNYIKNKIGADISLSNELEVINNKITGEVRIPAYFIKNEKSICNHSICKSNAVKYLSEKYNIDISNMIAVGDGENDICMVKLVGIGVSFCSDNKLLNSVADKIIKNKSFKELLIFAS